MQGQSMLAFLGSLRTNLIEKSPVNHIICDLKGRVLHTLGIYSQAYDFFRFMWNHTKPCKVVFVMMVLALTVMKPFQVAAVSHLVQYIETNPKTAPLWVYYINFIGFAIEKWIYWRYEYEILVPLNSQ
jgi:predicted Zn-dependent protease